jgi:hypothetical protein
MTDLEISARIRELEQENRILKNWLGIFMRCVDHLWTHMASGNQEASLEAYQTLFGHYKTAAQYSSVYALQKNASAHELLPPAGNRFDKIEF